MRAGARSPASALAGWKASRQCGGARLLLLLLLLLRRRRRRRRRRRPRLAQLTDAAEEADDAEGADEADEPGGDGGGGEVQDGHAHHEDVEPVLPPQKSTKPHFEEALRVNVRRREQENTGSPGPTICEAAEAGEERGSGRRASAGAARRRLGRAVAVAMSPAPHPGVVDEGAGPVAQEVDEQLDDEDEGEGRVEVVGHLAQPRGRPARGRVRSARLALSRDCMQRYAAG